MITVPWMAVVLAAAAFVVIGWCAHAARLRASITARPVRAVDGTVRGWRVYLGRLSLGPLRASRGDAERHAEALRKETL